MRIKHFSGYGTVNAKKVSLRASEGFTTLVIDVFGDHEWGLMRDDVFTLKTWLIDRFYKEAKNINPYGNIKVISEYIADDPETVRYTFIINTDPYRIIF